MKAILKIAIFTFAAFGLLFVTGCARFHRGHRCVRYGFYSTHCDRPSVAGVKAGVKGFAVGKRRIRPMMLVHLSSTVATAAAASASGAA